MMCLQPQMKHIMVAMFESLKTSPRCAIARRSVPIPRRGQLQPSFSASAWLYSVKATSGISRNGSLSLCLRMILVKTGLCALQIWSHSPPSWLLPTDQLALVAVQPWKVQCHAGKTSACRTPVHTFPMCAKSGSGCKGKSTSDRRCVHTSKVASCHAYKNKSS